MGRPSFYNQPSFAAGEIGPHLYGRVDQELYYIGLRTARNYVIRHYGGASNRAGGYFVGETKDSSKVSRLHRFQFNEIQTYVLEIGDGYMRFCADGGQVIESAVNVSAITKADPGVITANSHGFSNGDDVFIQGIVGMTQLNGRSVRVANVTTNTFEITDYQGADIDTTAYSTYGSGGSVSRIYTITTPWAADEVFGLRFAAKNDTLTVFHPDYFPRDITRTGNTAWTVGLFNPNGGPFQDKNSSDVTVTVDAYTGTGVTLTASADIFDSSMVGELFYIEQDPYDDTKAWEAAKSITAADIRRAGPNYYEAANTATTGSLKPDHLEGSLTDGDNGVEWEYLHSGFGIVEITAYTSATEVTVTVINRLPGNLVSVASGIWAKAAWSESQGYPVSGVYHKQRFIVGGTPFAPNRLWSSAVRLRAAFGNSNPILADEAFTVDLDTVEVNAIRHLVALKQLIALTSGSHQLINGVDNVLDATSPPVADVQENTTCSIVEPIIIGNTAIYVEDTGDLIRSMKYELAGDGFGGIDLTARSPHLFENKTIVDWTYQRRPLQVVWVVQDDGSLIGFTLVEEQKFYAWHRHDTDGTFESVTSIREGRENDVYQICNRTIDGVTKRYIERHASRRKREDVRDYFFVDCGLSYDGRNTSTKTITVSGGVTWAYGESMTLTASASTFTAEDVGNKIVFWYINDEGTSIALRFEITAYTSGTVVTAVATKSVPTAYQNAARTDWEFAKKVFYNFDHLEGKDASVFADGNVVNGLTFTDGTLTIPDAAAVVHAGLGYISDLETLDLAVPGGGSKAKVTNQPKLFITAQETRGIWAATDAFEDESINLNSLDSKFMKLKPRSPDIGYDLPIPAGSDLYEITLNSHWSRKQRVCLRHIDPTPITINCITPEVVLGEG